MKKNIIIGIISLFILGIAVPVFAQYGLKEAGNKAGYQESNIYSFTAKTINIGLSLLAIIFFGVMLYAGIRWMTARGNDELATKAKTALETGIIGLIIVLSAYAISNFVFSKLSQNQTAKSTTVWQR